MSRPESLQDRSFRFAVAIIRFYRRLTSSTDVPRHVAYQMLRAGTSTGANVEEAKSAYSRRDLAARYTIGLREARECRCPETPHAAGPESRPGVNFSLLSSAL